MSVPWAHAALMVLSAISAPAAAQPVSRDYFVAVEDRTTARALSEVWRAIDGYRHPVEMRTATSMFVVAPYEATPERHVGTPETIVPATDVEGALTLLFAHSDQRVSAIVPRADGDGVTRVVIDASSRATILVVLGDGARETEEPVGRASSEAHARFGIHPARDGEGWAVRHLGPTRADSPVQLTVPAGSRVLRVMQRSPPRTPIAIEWYARRVPRPFVRILHAESRVGEQLAVTLDGEPQRVHRRGTIRFPEVDLPDPLPRGRHEVRAQLLDAEGGVLEEARLALRGPAPYTVHPAADDDARCVTLDGDAVVEPRALDDVQDELRVTVGPTRERAGLLRAGTRICVRAPFYEDVHASRLRLAWSAGDVEPALLVIRAGRAISPAVLVGVPVAFFVLALVALFVGTMVSRPPLYLAWARQPDAYRDRDALAWRVVPVPDAPTPLVELDPDLEGSPHAITLDPSGARLLLGRAVIVASPGSEASVQIAEPRLSAGSQIVDGDLRLAVLGPREAAALAARGGPAPISAEALERARQLGFVGEAERERPRPTRAPWLVLAAVLATLAPFMPALLAVKVVPSIAPWAETAGAWWIGYAIGTAAIALAIAIVRARRARASP